MDILGHLFLTLYFYGINILFVVSRRSLNSDTALSCGAPTWHQMKMPVDVENSIWALEHLVCENIKYKVRKC